MTFPVLYDRVKETTTTTGTGTITLAGAAAANYITFTSVLSNKDVTPYVIEGTSEWEVGVGTFTTAGTTLSRDYVLASSNSGSLVNFSAGTKSVWVDSPASLLNAAQKNYIIGGDFSTNPWQRGTTFTAVATNAYTADRWFYAKNGTMVHDIDKNADAPTVAQAQRLTNHCLRIKVTTAEAVMGASDYAYVAQYVEGYNFIPLAQGYMAFSFWHKHTKTGTYIIEFASSTEDRFCMVPYTQTTTDTWELSTVIVPASPSAGTWDYTSGIGLMVRFFLAAGSGLNPNNDVQSAWASVFATTSVKQANACDSTSNYCRFALVQLQPGRICTQFVGQKIDEVVLDCERYYQKTFAAGTAPATNVGIDTGELNFISRGAGVTDGVRWLFRTRMRGVPTITTFNPAAANALIRNRGSVADFISVGSINLHETGVYIFGTSDLGGSSGNTAAVHATAEKEL